MTFRQLVLILGAIYLGLFLWLAYLVLSDDGYSGFADLKADGTCCRASN
jgi:hypothetical protein